MLQPADYSDSNRILPRVLKVHRSPPPLHGHLSFDNFSYTELIKSATRGKSPLLGKLAHIHIIKTRFKPCLYLLNNLLNLYAKNNEMYIAQTLFDNMPTRDVISYNSLISGYSNTGFYDKSFKFFLDFRRNEGMLPDRYTYASLLSVCAKLSELRLGKVIHGLVTVSGMGGGAFLINSLIDMYCKCGRVDVARVLFETSDDLDVVSWNSLIAGYVGVGNREEMLRVLVKMQQCGLGFNSFLFGSAFKACCLNFHGASECGKMLHACSVKTGLDLDVFVGTALLDMYAKTGDLTDAIKIFKLIPEHNNVMYNAMIAGFSRAESISEETVDEALCLFTEMKKKGIQPSKFTFSTVLKVCNLVVALEFGKQIHAQICKNNLQSDEFIGSTLVELYSLSGLIQDAVKCFNTTPKQDIVTWTSMTTGHVQNEQFECALSLFVELLAFGRKPDEFTISSMFAACANLAAARSGEQIQGYAMKFGMENFTIIRNSQICMYSNFGDLDSANLIFEETKYPDVVSWSVIIRSNGQHGSANEALHLFELMKIHEINPNHVTFLGVLTACSHGGLVEEGLRYFESMITHHSVTPNVKHYACIVDLLGRAGRLADAEAFIWKSEFQDDPVIWRALLSACRMHKNISTGHRVAERVIELEPQAAAAYVLLYNIYTDSGMEIPANKVRKLMNDRGVKKEPGLSWIEVGNTFYSFVVGDRSHPKSEIIYSWLEETLKKIEKLGYVDERSKACSEINHHSEKLAVSFGILSLPSSAPVRVIKNLRVCQDCHTTMKLISKVEEREIILRDAIRFHRFRGGSCSCQDYW